MEKDYKSTIEWLTKELTQAQEEIKNIQAIEKEHQRINGELREENNRLKLMTSYNEYTKRMEKETREIIEAYKILYQQYISVYNQYCEELKRKNEAIEYIEKHIRFDDEYPAYMELLIEERDELLEILKEVE